MTLRLVGFYVGLQNGDGLFHGACRLHHLREKHLSLAEQLTHHVHSSHQRTFDNIHGPRIFLQRLGKVFFQMVANALHQSLLKPFLERKRQSRNIFFRGSCNGVTCFSSSLLGVGLCLQGGSQFHKRLGSTLPTVQHNVLDGLQLVLWNIGIGHLSGGIHNAEVHALLDGMVKEDGMHGLADIVVAAERETQVAHATADVGSGQISPNPSGSADKVDGIVVVLLHARGDGQHIGVENDVQRVHPHPLGQYLVGALGNLYATLVAGGLSLFVETHHHHGSTETLHALGMTYEHFLALLQRDAVHDALALHALQRSLDDFPFR